MRILLIPVTLAFAVVAGCVESQRMRSNLGGPPASTDTAHDPKKQTLASKVLGAIALEAVTKRKADPGRLNQLRQW
jgi:hypothetical protein